jgi:hypothetical protein
MAFVEHLFHWHKESHAQDIPLMIFEIAALADH